jgi:hypothetical protein
MLRKRKRAGVVRPRGDPQTGYRVCNAATYATLCSPARRGGYLVDQISFVDRPSSAPVEASRR